MKRAPDQHNLFLAISFDGDGCGVHADYYPDAGDGVDQLSGPSFGDAFGLEPEYSVQAAYEDDMGRYIVDIETPGKEAWWFDG